MPRLLQSALIVLLVALVAATAVSQPAPECIDYAQTPLPLPDFAALGGQARTPLVMGELAYIPAGTAGLHVVDFSMPGSPVHVTTLTGFTDCRDLARLGDAVYAADDNGSLKVIDATLPLSPAVIGSGYFAGQTAAVATAGTLLVAGDTGGILHFYDVSDPLAPVLVRHLIAAASILGLALEGDQLYVATGGSLLVYDVSDPTLPVADRSTGGAYFRDVVVQNGIVYVTDYWTGGVRIFDASGPDFLVPRGQTVSGGNATAVDVLGTTMAVACGADGVVLYDVTDLAQPVRMVGGIGAGNATGVHLEPDRVWVADETAGCGPWDWVGVVDPVMAISRDAPVPEAVVTVGSIAYVADSGRGLVILDIADHRRPRQLGVLSFLEDPRDVVVTGSIAYVALRNSVIHVVDISNPAAPTPITSAATSGGCESLALGDGILAVSVYGAGVDLFDVTAPASPVKLGNISPSDGARAAAFAGNVLYIAENYGGLAVYDVSNPVVPLHLHQFPTDHRAAGVTVAGDALYVCAWREGLEVYDISDPHNPLAQPDVAVPGWPLEMAVDGAKGYVATEFGGLVAVDLNDPLQPQVESPLVATGVRGAVFRPAFSGGAVVLPVRYGDLALVHDHCFDFPAPVPDREIPGTRLSVDLAPNPFNPTTTISLVVPGERTVPVDVDVFDLRGRHVRNLAAGRMMAPGHRSLEWNGIDDGGRPVTSGVYFVRVVTPKAGSTSKAVLLK